MKTKLLLSTGFILLVYGLCWVSLETPIRGEVSIADKKSILAMKYHGIDFCQNTPEGTYFQRDGQRCRLYTEAFNEWYAKETR